MEHRMALVVLEGLVMGFWLLLVCVVGIADGPIGLVCFYERDVQERVVELGLTTPGQIRRSSTAVAVALFAPVLLAVPAMVYVVNGAVGFWDGFTQLTAIYLIMGLFDRLFIDWWWVGHTKAWHIPGTEDLMPYIPTSAQVRKWVGTLVGFPLLAAIVAGLLALVL